MKKEKKRNLTIQQLEKKNDFVSNIGGISVVILIIFLFAGSMHSMYYGYSSEQLVTKLDFIIFAILVGLIFILIILAGIANYKISEAKRKLTIETIKEYAQKEILNQLVSIKSEKIMDEVLANNIAKISGIKKDEDTLTVDIKSSQSSKTYPLTLSIYKFLDILDKDVKKEIFEDLVKDIKLKNKIFTIKGAQGNLYVGTVTDEDLIEFFEFKN